MSKTSPVRWWRDDATRYEARPLVGVYRTRTQPRLEFAPLPPPDPELAAAWDFINQRISTLLISGAEVPAELLAPVPMRPSGLASGLAFSWIQEPTSADVIADVRRALGPGVRTDVHSPDEESPK